MAPLSRLVGSLQEDLAGEASGTEPGSRVRPTHTRGYNCSSRSAGQETRLKVPRSLRPGQLTVVEMRQEASLRVSSLAQLIWPPPRVALPGPLIPCPSCPLPVSRPFSCSGDDDWGCMSRWHHMEGGTIWAQHRSITGSGELQFPLPGCSEASSALNFFILLGWAREPSRGKLRLR